MSSCFSACRLAVTLFFAVLITLTALSGASAQQTNRSDENARTTRSLAREVRGELASLPYYDVFDYLEFEVRPDRTVVLRGQTVRPTLKRTAQSLVEDIEGVARVDNQIEVLPLSPNDDRIRLAIYRELFNQNSPLFRYSLGAVPPIRIIVKNGRVTLKGLVSTEADRNLAGVRARTVSGVFEVTNELQVEKREDVKP